MEPTNTRVFAHLQSKDPVEVLKELISVFRKPATGDGKKACQYLFAIPGLNIYQGGWSTHVKEPLNITKERCNYDCFVFYSTNPSRHPSLVKTMRQLWSYDERRIEGSCNNGLGCGKSHKKFYEFGNRSQLERHLRMTNLLVRFANSEPYVLHSNGWGKESVGSVGHLVLNDHWKEVYEKFKPLTSWGGFEEMLLAGLGISGDDPMEMEEIARLGQQFDQNRGILQEPEGAQHPPDSPFTGNFQLMDIGN